MEFESYRRERPTINLSAMIDVVFILVIFIVLAASFHRLREIEVNLPHAESGAKPSPEALLVTIPPRGAFRIQGEVVERDQLLSRLTVLRREFESVVLLADEQVPLARAVRVLGDARTAGFTSLSIATKETASDGSQSP
jgi:biopolymer transport protein ExbD